MPEFNTKVSIQSFQQCDGSNFSTAGLDITKPIGKGSLSGYAGLGTSFKEGTTGAVIDFKGGLSYGKSILSGGFRIRHNITKNSKSVQFRLQPLTVTVPVAKNTNIYTTPYAATKIIYGGKGANTTVGNFTGVSAKFGKVNMFLEGQIYDITEINPSNTSVNIGLSINL